MVQRSDKVIITNIHVLGSDNHTHNSCNKISRELSEDDEICLEIYSVALLSMSDDTDGIYANGIEPHNIIMNVTAPKCFGTTNIPCCIMIIELIGSVS